MPRADPSSSIRRAVMVARGLGRDIGQLGHAGGGSVNAVLKPRFPDQQIVNVDIAKANKLWSRDKDFHVPSAAPGQNAKLDRAKSFISGLAPHDEFETPSMGVIGNGPDFTRVGFDDGRHRFAAMRDLGMKTAPVSMDGESIKAAQKAGLIASALRKANGYARGGFAEGGLPEWEDYGQPAYSSPKYGTLENVLGTNSPTMGQVFGYQYSPAVQRAIQQAATVTAPAASPPAVAAPAAPPIVANSVKFAGYPGVPGGPAPDNTIAPTPATPDVATSQPVAPVPPANISATPAAVPATVAPTVPATTSDDTSTPAQTQAPAAVTQAPTPAPVAATTGEVSATPAANVSPPSVTAPASTGTTTDAAVAPSVAASPTPSPTATPTPSAPTKNEPNAVGIALNNIAMAMLGTPPDAPPQATPSPTPESEPTPAAPASALSPEHQALSEAMQSVATPSPTPESGDAMPDTTAPTPPAPPTAPAPPSSGFLGDTASAVGNVAGKLSKTVANNAAQFGTDVGNFVSPALSAVGNAVNTGMAAISGMDPATVNAIASAQSLGDQANQAATQNANMISTPPTAMSQDAVADPAESPANYGTMAPNSPFSGMQSDTVSMPASVTGAVGDAPAVGMTSPSDADAAAATAPGVVGGLGSIGEGPGVAAGSVGVAGFGPSADAPSGIGDMGGIGVGDAAGDAGDSGGDAGATGDGGDGGPIKRGGFVKRKSGRSHLVDRALKAARRHKQDGGGTIDADPNAMYRQLFLAQHPEGMIYPTTAARGGIIDRAMMVACRARS